MPRSVLTYCRSSFEAAFDRLERYNRARYRYNIRYFGRRALVWCAVVAGLAGGIMYYNQLITVLSLSALAAFYYSLRCLLSWSAEQRFLAHFRQTTRRQLEELDRSAGFSIEFDEDRIVLWMGSEQETYNWQVFSFFIDDALFIYLGDNRRNSHLLLPADAIPEPLFEAFRFVTRRNIRNELLLDD